MIIKISKKSFKYEIVSITEDNIDENCTVVITKGISEFLNNPELRLQILNELSIGDEVFVVVPDKIEEQVITAQSEYKEFDAAPNEGKIESNDVEVLYYKKIRRNKREAKY